MIPKTLLTAFLSLRITTKLGAPQQADHQDLEAPARAQRLGYHTPYHIPVDHNVNPAQANPIDINLEDGHCDKQQKPLTIGISSSGGDQTFPFDTMPSGTWDDSAYHNSVLITNHATSWIWSLPDDFPNIKPYGFMRKAWGPYPDGNSVSIYLDPPALLVEIAFAFSIDGEFAEGSYHMDTYLEGDSVGSDDSPFDKDWHSVYAGYVDHVDFVVTPETMEPGILLIGSLEWERDS